MTTTTDNMSTTEQETATMATTTKATSRPKRPATDPALAELSAATAAARSELSRLRDHADDLSSQRDEAGAALADHQSALAAGELPDRDKGIAISAQVQYLRSAVEGAEGAVQAAAETFRLRAEFEAEHRIQHLGGGPESAEAVRVQAVKLATEAQALMASWVEQRNDDLASVAELLREGGSAVVGVDGRPADGADVGVGTSSVFAGGVLHKRLNADQSAGRWLAAGLNGHYRANGRNHPVEKVLQPARDFTWPTWIYAENPARDTKIGM